MSEKMTADEVLHELLSAYDGEQGYATFGEDSMDWRDRKRLASAEARFALAFAVLEEVEGRAAATMPCPPESPRRQAHDILTAARARLEAETDGEDDR